MLSQISLPLRPDIIRPPLNLMYKKCISYFFRKFHIVRFVERIVHQTILIKLQWPACPTRLTSWPTTRRRPPETRSTPWRPSWTQHTPTLLVRVAARAKNQQTVRSSLLLTYKLILFSLLFVVRLGTVQLFSF